MKEKKRDDFLLDGRNFILARASGRQTTTTPSPSPPSVLLLCFVLVVRVDGFVNLIGIAFHLLCLPFQLLYSRVPATTFHCDFMLLT